MRRKTRKKIMITLTLLIVMAIIATKGAVDGSSTEAFYTNMINVLYGTNHTVRPDECGRDWTYFHYIATETATVLILQVLHGVFSVYAFIKLWKKNNNTLTV